MRERSPFCGWPGWRHVVYGYGVLGLPLSLSFALIYGGANYVAGLHDFRVPLHFELELNMPFVPAMVGFYNSFHLVYLMTPFVLRTRHEMRAIAIVWFWVTFVGGIFFLILPVENAYPAPTEDELGGWAGLFELADRANLDYNSFPSLHVAWGVVGIEAFAGKAQRMGRILLWSWAVAMMASTMLLHQHYLLDVLGGFVLALAATRLLRQGPPRWRCG